MLSYKCAPESLLEFPNFVLITLPGKFPMIFEYKTIKYWRYTMGRKNGFRAFVFGGLIGAAVAMLYAPYSGEKTRTLLINNGQVIKDKAMNSIREAQVRMESLTEESKKRLGQLQEIGQHTLEEQKQSLKEGLKQAKEVVGGSGHNGGVSGEIYS
jgi:gas vesicle protein